MHFEQQQLTRARALRKDQTAAERWLWWEFRQRFKECRLRRQHRIGPYIVDFYCLSKRLVIELDGGHHKDKGQAQYDSHRSAYLRSQNLRVLRCWNGEVLKNKEKILQDLAILMGA